MTELAAAPPAKLGATERRDAWWAGPLATFLGLSSFVVYTTFRAIYNADYEAGSLLSPLYSPLLVWDDMPSWLSPSFLVMWAPGGFRLTCYYYRKAYYRSFALDPPACAVGEPWGDGYKGESTFPLVLQNLHRYFLYASIAVWFFLTYDTIKAFFFHGQFGIGLGSLVLVVNLTLLSGYLFGCHSLRHIVGGNIDCYSCALGGKARHGAWRRASWFNKRHMPFAWFSLVFVCLTDLYIRLVAMGTIQDFRFF